MKDFLNYFPLEDCFLLEEEIQREIEEVLSVVMKRNIDLITERLLHTSRSSCDSSLNGTYEKYMREACKSYQQAKLLKEQYLLEMKIVQVTFHSIILYIRLRVLQISLWKILPKKGGMI